MVIAETTKKGYKQTEFGLIPEDWGIFSLDNCLKLLTDFEANGSFESVAKNVNIYDNENYAWYVRATDLEKNSNLLNVKFVDESTYKFLKKTCLKGGEVLITKRGEIGKVYFFQMKTEHATVAPNMYLLKLNDLVVPYYIYSFFKAEIGNKLLKEKNASSTLGALYKDDIKSIQILLPPTKSEQISISNILLDINTLIEHLEKLIEKKKAIKQGTMQQLMTGKKRLPGFNDEWKIQKLPKACWYQEGPGVRSYQFTASGVKLLNGTNISNGKIILDYTNRFVSEKEAFGWYKHFLVDDGDILIASSGITIDRFDEKVSFASLKDLPLCMNTSTIRFKVNSNLLDKYLYYFLKSDLFKNQIGKQATGSAQLNFGPSHLNKIDINFPKNKEEQKAISDILFDIDSEIENLEKKRDKYIMVKQGMMQQLLTGKIRIYGNN